MKINLIFSLATLTQSINLNTENNLDAKALTGIALTTENCTNNCLPNICEYVECQFLAAEHEFC